MAKKTAADHRDTIERPNFLSDDGWQAWNEWLDWRGSIKIPNTSRALARAMQTLSEAHDKGYDANEVIEIVLERGWRGVYIPTNLKVSQGSLELTRPKLSEVYGEKY